MTGFEIILLVAVIFFGTSLVLLIALKVQGRLKGVVGKSGLDISADINQKSN